MVFTVGLAGAIRFGMLRSTMAARVQISLIAGLLGTAIMSLAALAIAAAGGPRLDAAALMAYLLDVPGWAGWLAHFAIGVTLAAFYVLVLARLLRRIGSPAVQGAVFGVIAVGLAQAGFAVLGAIFGRTPPMVGSMAAMAAASMVEHIVFGIVVAVAAAPVLTPLRLRQKIARPVGDVFGAVIDLESFPRWNPTTKAARKLGTGPARAGSRFELDVRGFGPTVQELQDFVLDRRVRLVPHIDAIAGGHLFALTPVADGTQIDHELEMQPKGWYLMMAPILCMVGKRNLRKTAAALQAYLEAVTPVARS
jgi:hypothetical protein